MNTIIKHYECYKCKNLQEDESCPVMKRIYNIENIKKLETHKFCIWYEEKKDEN